MKIKLILISFIVNLVMLSAMHPDLVDKAPAAVNNTYKSRLLYLNKLERALDHTISEIVIPSGMHPDLVGKTPALMNKSYCDITKRIEDLKQQLDIKHITIPAEPAEWSSPGSSVRRGRSVPLDSHGVDDKTARNLFGTKAKDPSGVPSSPTHHDPASDCDPTTVRHNIPAGNSNLPANQDKETPQKQTWGAWGYEKYQAAKDKAYTVTQAAKDKAYTVTQAAKDKLSSAYETAKAHPYATGAAAVGAAGAAAALVLKNKK